MLFKVLVVSLVCLALGHAQILKRYQSQMVLQMVLHPSENAKVCDCTKGSCKLNQKVAETMCKAITERFVFFAHPSPYFMLCEVNRKSCTDLDKGVPRTTVVDLIFDNYYMKVAPFFFGSGTPQNVFENMMYRPQFGVVPGFEKRPISSHVTAGITSMPIEFIGVLNMKASDAAKWHMCYETACLQYVNKLCDEFVNAMNTVKSDLMSQFMGCHIRRIYVVGQETRISWSLMFYHRYLIERKIVKTYDELKTKIQAVVSKLKLPSLKTFKHTGFEPLDYCEITASALTTQRYHPNVSDPISFRYRTDSHAYYSKLLTQLMAGDYKIPSCVRRALGLNFSNKNGLAEISIGLWVSLTCYKERGMKNCKEATEDIRKIWQKGQKYLFNDWASEYNFKLTHQGAAFNV